MSGKQSKSKKTSGAKALEKKSGNSGTPTSSSAQDSNQQKFPHLLIAIFLLLCGNALYFPSGSFEVTTYDDTEHINNNPALAEFSLENLKRIWTEPYIGMYIPLTYTVWSAERAAQRSFLSGLFKNEAQIFHWSNILTHCATAFVVYLILFSLGGAQLAAVLGAMLFLLHPLQVETVSWISSFRDLLAAQLALLSLWQFVVFLKQSKREYVHYSLSIFFYLLALFAKPSAVFLGPMLFVVAVFLTNKSVKHALAMIWPFLLIALPIVIINKNLQPDSHIHFVPPLWFRPIIAADTLTFYFAKFLMPLNLGFDYGRSPKWLMENSVLFFSWTVPVFTFLYLAGRKDLRTYFAAFLLLVLGAFPQLGIVPFAHQDLSTPADRYFYLAMFGPALALTFLTARHNSLRVPALGWLLVLSVVSFRTQWHWQSNDSILERTLQINPDSAVANNNRGVALKAAGRTLEAVSRFEKALQTDAKYHLAQINLISALGELGRYSEAENYYREVTQQDQGLDAAHINWGWVLERQGKHDEAIAIFEKALKARPNSSAGLNNIGLAYAKKGEFEKAKEYFQKALAISKDDISAHLNLGAALYNLNDLDGAKAQFGEVLKRDAVNLNALNNVGAIHLRQGDPESALKYFDRAMAIDPSALKNIHAALQLLCAANPSDKRCPSVE